MNERSEKLARMRANAPELATFIDSFRAEFPKCQLLYIKVGDDEVGKLPKPTSNWVFNREPDFVEPVVTKPRRSRRR